MRGESGTICVGVCVLPLLQCYLAFAFL
eukprot:COSAG04_NODE_20320_length_396_cov_0.855219_1_plen_27_part_10